MEAQSTTGGQSALPAGAAGAPEPPNFTVEDVRAAIENNQFVVYSQPIQDLKTGAVASEELLVRMKMADGQLITPFAFLSIAEAFGLVAEIDAMMVGKGIELARRGRKVAVNLSAHSLSNAGITERVEAAVEAGLDPANLGFEISENSAGTDIDAAKALAERLTHIGCELAVDEFGIGFASLQFVKHLPVDTIKVGREFVGDLPRSLDDYHVLGCIVDLATKLGRKTAAVGVEDGLTLELVKRLGVDYAQGFSSGTPPREVDVQEPRAVERRRRPGLRHAVIRRQLRRLRRLLHSCRCRPLRFAAEPLRLACRHAQAAQPPAEAGGQPPAGRAQALPPHSLPGSRTAAPRPPRPNGDRRPPCARPGIGEGDAQFVQAGMSALGTIEGGARFGDRGVSRRRPGGPHRDAGVPARPPGASLRARGTALRPQQHALEDGRGQRALSHLGGSASQFCTRPTR